MIKGPILPGRAPKMNLPSGDLGPRTEHTEHADCQHGRNAIEDHERSLAGDEALRAQRGGAPALLHALLFQPDSQRQAERLPDLLWRGTSPGTGT